MMVRTERVPCFGFSISGSTWWQNREAKMMSYSQKMLFVSWNLNTNKNKSIDKQNREIKQHCKYVTVFYACFHK